MTNLRTLLVAAVAALCMLARADTVEWLTFPVGLNHELSVTKDGISPLRVPARFATSASKLPTVLQVRMFDVAGRSGRTGDIAKQFKVSWKPATGEQAMALVFEVTPDSTGLLPGAYAVAVDIAPNFSVAGAKIQTVTFSLTVPTPTLSSVPIVLHQTRVWNESGTSPPVELSISEDSRKASAKRLRITASRDSVEKDHDDNGFIVVPVTPAVVGPGAAASVPISTSGAFALGKTSGKLKIDSPELAAPTVVAFEVHARREPFWIGCIAVAGIILGYLVRVVLVKRRELLEARIAASDAIHAIDEQISSSDDATSRGALQKLRDALVAAGKVGDAKALTDLAKKSIDSAATARSELNERLKALVGQVDAAHVLVDRSWPPIPGAQQSLEALKATTAELDRLLSRRDAGAVQMLLSAGLREKLAGYVNARQTHMSQVAEYFHAMAAKPPPVPPAAIDSIKALAKELDSAYPSDPGDLQSISVDDAATRLAALETGFSRCQKLVQGESVQAGAFVNIAQHKLLVVPGDPDRVFAPLREATGKLLGSAVLCNELADPQVPAANYQAKILRLGQLWDAVLVEVTPAARRGVVQPNFRAKIEQGDWTAAVEIAAKEVPSAGANLGTPQSLAEAAKSLVADDGRSGMATLPLAGPDSRTYEHAIVLTGSPIQRAQLEAQAQKAGFLQSAVLAVVFVLGLYALYEDSWIGSLKEMLALFLVAFGVDLTYDGVAGELKKGKAGGA